jgi:hypothetical protein
MDEQGEAILGTWLYGGGEAHDIETDSWTRYMMRHESLRQQILNKLMLAVDKIAERKTLGRFTVSERFHAEFPENSGFSGYALLHGTNRTVGDFLLSGWAEVQEANVPKDGNFDIEMDLRFTWNDIVDPNAKYAMDTIRSTLAKIVTFGQAKDYRLSINWGSSCLAEVRKGQRTVFSGYPSPLARSIRPLPVAKLDLAAAEKKRAQEIETKVLAQLKRRIPSGDIASLADRKRRLLWLFFELRGWWSSTYINRIKTPAGHDELTRLLHHQVSSALRAEITDTLRGKRPQGAPPLW